MTKKAATSSELNDDLLKTPEKSKGKSQRNIRRRSDGSPMVPLNYDLPTKVIYLIRHGQSQGQVAKHHGLDRQRDNSLRDCPLTSRGESEAIQLPGMFSEEEFDSLQLVMSSPLTRALHTSLLGFPSKKVLVHFDLREVGNRAPENVPRTMKAVVKDLNASLRGRPEAATVDCTSLQPPDWPRDSSPNVIKKERIRQVFRWLYNQREETNIAVICHYNVIRSAVIDGEKLRPKNAIPIRCSLFSNGELFVQE